MNPFYQNAISIIYQGISKTIFSLTRFGSLQFFGEARKADLRFLFQKKQMIFATIGFASACSSIAIATIAYCYFNACSRQPQLAEALGGRAVTFAATVEALPALAIIVAVADNFTASSIPEAVQSDYMIAMEDVEISPEKD